MRLGSSRKKNRAADWMRDALLDYSQHGFFEQNAHSGAPRRISAEKLFLHRDER